MLAITPARGRTGGRLPARGFRRGAKLQSLLVASLLALITLHSAPAGAEAERVKRNKDLTRRAFASWSEGDEGAVRFVEAARVTRKGREVAVGLIGTSDCVDPDRGPCIAATIFKRISKDDFHIEPDLSRAELQMELDGDDHRFRWSGEGTHRYHKGRVRRPAEGVGVVAGEREATRGPEARAVLSQGTRGTHHGLPGGFGAFSSIGRHPDTSFGSGCSSYRSPERTFSRLMNLEREKKGLAPMKLDPHLTAVSRHHTNEMIRKGALYHTSADRLSFRVTGWRGLGENIGAGASATSLHSSFMNSPTHRDNILFPDFRYVGVGTRKANGKLWVTVTFERSSDPGTRLSC